MIDSHAHLSFKFEKAGKTPKSPVDQLKSASTAGVTDIMCILLDNYETEFTKVDKPILKHNGKLPTVYYSAGIHPDHETAEALSTDQKLTNLILFVESSRKISAIGECGLDYYDTKMPKKEQEALLNRQIELANSFHLPMIIHTRPSSLESTDAYVDMHAILKSNTPKFGFVIHCFSADPKTAKMFLELGAFIGFAGNLTYPKAEIIKEAAKYIPLDRILTETDAPFLAPQAYRGGINESAFVVEVAKELANLKGISLPEVESITTKNFLEFVSGD
ncbi:TatD family hydrolase [Candidatus Dojkabacteria bacterium]|nr:TatD family hydrolase [Candidatus Dojkabacteria bacterium]